MVRGPRGDATETSRLLLPSPNLTDNASTLSLLADMEPGIGAGAAARTGSAASIYSHDSDIQLRIFSGRDRGGGGGGWGDDTGGVARWRRHRRLMARVAAASLLTGALAAIGSYYLWEAPGSPTTPSVPIRHDVFTGAAPFSTKDPVLDLGLPDFDRPKDSKPPKTLTDGDGTSDGGNDSNARRRRALPTNAWYQNLLMTNDGEPSSLNRVYTIPYLIDAAGSIPGLRFFANHVAASSSIVQVYSVDEYGMVLGAGADLASSGNQSSVADTSGDAHHLSNAFRVRKMTSLAVTLDWNDFPMSSSIVKGMPYVTMIYNAIESANTKGDRILPTVSSMKPLAIDPIADRRNTFKCDGMEAFRIEREIELLVAESDFTWLVFFSEPTMIQCRSDKELGMSIQVVNTVDNRDDYESKPLIIRVAWLKSCSTGGNPIYCHQEQLLPSAYMLGQGLYGEVLRNHSIYYPGPNADFSYAVPYGKNSIDLTFDWDTQQMSPYVEDTYDGQLITFALPHHYELFDTMPKFDSQIYCYNSLIGPACLASGNQWHMTEAAPDISMRAPRPPAPWAMHPLAESLKDDIQYRIAGHYKKGAGDTYFSGKRLAKLARILAIADEMVEICMAHDALYVDECKGLTLPSSRDIENAVKELRVALEIWFNGEAAAPFVYDSAWGGVISCGCDFDDGTKSCKNRFPHCPAFTDPGLDFGNGYYNDHHFHYGYMIQAAAVLTHFDHEWGRKYFEQVVLLIRDIANPSDNDASFPKWRQKDWYQGHSWASGIAQTYLNGKNQESSSEAIAAYEAIALYGKIMAAVGKEIKDRELQRVAEEIHAAGLVATATELRSARKYWHIIRGGNDEIKIYPQNYVEFAVGMLWQTMTQFQTWFGSQPFLAFGIQLLPLTPIAEARDGVEWAKMMYQSLSESCYGDRECTESGWGVGVRAILATAGHPQMALEQIQMMPAEAFDGPAGDGHSLSNTIWYIATRPVVKPLELDRKNFKHDEAPQFPVEYTLTDCGRPSKCTDLVLDTIAGLYSCRQRMQWLIWQEGKTETEACGQVAGIENIRECGACSPNGGDDDDSAAVASQCGPCTEAECNDGLLNRCPRYFKTFVCTDGPSRGGCSPVPWDLQDQCQACCEISACKEHSRTSLVPVSQSSPVKPTNNNLSSEEAECPACEKEICRSRINQCPHSGAAPYLCYEGASRGGCAPEPWAVGTKQCDKCCKVMEDCGDSRRLQPSS